MDSKRQLTKEEALALGDEILNVERAKRPKFGRRWDDHPASTAESGLSLLDPNPFIDPRSPYYFYYH